MSSASGGEFLAKNTPLRYNALSRPGGENGWGGLDERDREDRDVGRLPDDPPREAGRGACRLRAERVGCTGAVAARLPYAAQGRHHERRRSRATGAGWADRR